MTSTQTNQKELLLNPNSSFDNIQEFDGLFRTLMTKTWVFRGKEYHLPTLGWEKGYSRSTSALGSCRRKRNLRTRELSHKKVLISKVLFNENPEKGNEWEDVVRHEIAHAIDVEFRGVSDHGYIWKEICVAVGANPSRLYEGDELKKPKKKFALVCPDCGHTHPRSRRVKAGIYYTCAANATCKSKKVRLNFVENK